MGKVYVYPSEAKEFIDKYLWVILAILFFCILYFLGKIYLGSPFFP